MLQVLHIFLTSEVCLKWYRVIKSIAAWQSLGNETRIDSILVRQSRDTFESGGSYSRTSITSTDLLMGLSLFYWQGTAVFLIRITKIVARAQESFCNCLCLSDSLDKQCWGWGNVWDPMNDNNCIMERRRSCTATGTAHLMLGAQEASITRFMGSLPVRVSCMHCLTCENSFGQ